MLLQINFFFVYNIYSLCDKILYMFACVYFHELDFSTLVVGIFILVVTSGDDSSDDLV